MVFNPTACNTEEFLLKFIDGELVDALDLGGLPPVTVTSPPVFSLWMYSLTTLLQL